MQGGEPARDRSQHVSGWVKDVGGASLAARGVVELAGGASLRRHAPSF